MESFESFENEGIHEVPDNNLHGVPHRIWCRDHGGRLEVSHSALNPCPDLSLLRSI